MHRLRHYSIEEEKDDDKLMQSFKEKVQDVINDLNKDTFQDGSRWKLLTNITLIHNPETRCYRISD